VSNFIIRQQGPSPVVADNLWEIRLGAGVLLLGALAGGLGGLLVGLHLGRRGKLDGGTRAPKDWPAKPVNIAHRGGKDIVPENTLEGFREGLRVGTDVLEFEVHLTADGHLVAIHDDTVDRTTDGSGPVREKTLRELKGLDAGHWFTRDGGKTYPYRGQGITIPALEEIYREFSDVPVNVEIKEDQPDIERSLWQVVEQAEATDRTLVVSGKTSIIRRFREVSGGRVATGSSAMEILVFDLLRRLRLSRLLRPSYRALQVPEGYRNILRLVTPSFVRSAHQLGVRVDVWTINTEPDMRRVLGYGVDGIMTDRPDILAQLLQGEFRAQANDTGVFRDPENSREDEALGVDV
jgi:glycerophosphoryl diester phosphodiesterase